MASAVASKADRESQALRDRLRHMSVSHNRLVAELKKSRTKTATDLVNRTPLATAADLKGEVELEEE